MNKKFWAHPKMKLSFEDLLSFMRKWNIIKMYIIGRFQALMPQTSNMMILMQIILFLQFILMKKTHLHCFKIKIT